VTEYRIACFSSDLRRAAFRRDGGQCFNCSAQGGEWEADHIAALWRVPANLPLGDRHLWWGMGNIQTLCRTCHGYKTAFEAGQRKLLRRRPT
jgi:5-methylcytosine-specific restriction endonuclease McrA